MKRVSLGTGLKFRELSLELIECCIKRTMKCKLLTFCTNHHSIIALIGFKLYQNII